MAMRLPRYLQGWTAGWARGCLDAMSESIPIQIVYEDAGEGWIMARIPTVQGAMSQGRTRAEARENVLDALRLMLAPEPGGSEAVPAGADFDSLELTLSE